MSFGWMLHLLICGKYVQGA